jgi:hypothetical protein
MMIPILYILGIKGMIGPSWGYYSPGLCSVNACLIDSGYRKLPNTCMSFGGGFRLGLMDPLSIELYVDWYKGYSPEKKHSLFVVPIDIFFTSRIVILPLFLRTYVGGGLVMAHCVLEGELLNRTTWLTGGGAKIGIEFIPTPRLGVEMSYEWRFISEKKAPNLPVPIELSGGVFRITFERVFQ